MNRYGWTEHSQFDLMALITTNERGSKCPAVSGYICRIYKQIDRVESLTLSRSLLR